MQKNGNAYIQLARLYNDTAALESSLTGAKNFEH